MNHNYSKVSPPASPLSSGPPSPTPDHTHKSLSRANSNEGKLTAAAKRNKYLRRIIRFRQMDFEYAFWQMIYLFVAPQKVYRNFQYRKYTKDQWARDDPAFLVILSFWLVASSIGFAVVLGVSFVGFLKFILWVIFIDCIGVGILVATIFWFLLNRYMILSPPRGQDVEWGYAFDVHLNAFYPLLMILHLFQLIFITYVRDSNNFFLIFIGNTCWLVAIFYYIYITFLGYSALPFVKNTRILLYPMTFFAIMYIVSLALRWNLDSGLCNFYEYRV